VSSTAIIIPFFNESLRIGHGQYLSDLSKAINADFYYVNDGSSDDTQIKLKLIANRSKAEVIELKRNFGKGEAIRQGLREAIGFKNYKVLGYLDADGAFPLTEVERSTRLALEVFNQSPTADIYIASRVKLAGKEISRSSIRHYLSRLIITLIGLKTQNMPYDSQSGLKFFRNTQVLRVSLDKPFKTRWFFDLELMTRVGMQDKDCVWEEPVNSWSDIKGSKIRAGAILSIAKEILVIRGLISRR